MIVHPHFKQVGAPGSPGAFVAQMLKMCEPRAREAFSDLQRQIHQQHADAIDEFWTRALGKSGFKKLGRSDPPTDPRKKLTWTQKRQLAVAEHARGMIEQTSHPTRLEDDFIFADGDAVKIVTYGVQGGAVPPGCVRYSTTAVVNLDGGEHAFHVFPPVDVRL